MMRKILCGMLLCGVAVLIYAQQQQKTPEEVSFEDQLLTMQEKLAREGISISIDKTNAKVEEIVEEFRKQTGISFILDSSRIPEDFRIPEFKVSNIPFKEAFGHFLKIAQLVIAEETANVIRIERPILMTLNLKDSDIKEVLDLISRISGVNIIIAPDKISGKVSISVTDVPWSEVLESVVKMLGYATVREKYNVVRVVPIEDLVKQFETKVFRLKYLQPSPTYRAKIEAQPYFAGQSLDTPKSLAELTAAFPFLKIVEAALTKSAAGVLLGRLDYDANINALVVTDAKPVLDKIQQIINILDLEPEQVIIDVKFISTTNTELLQFGIDYWSIDHDLLLKGGLAYITRTKPSQTMIPPLGAGPQWQTFPTMLPFGLTRDRSSIPASVRPTFFLSEYDARAVIRAFEKDTYSKLLQQPTLAVIDNTEATIFVGEKIPYAEQQVTVAGGQQTVTLKEGSKSPVKVGFQLLVIPRILREENKVILTIIPTNEALTGTNTTLPGFERFTIAGQEIFLPRIGQTIVFTRLKIEDGHTAIIGGLVQERVSMEDRGLPVLKDIPIINFLFKMREDTVRKDHLLIFITPRIVRSEKAISEFLARKLRSKEQELKKELDELKKLREQNGYKPQFERRMKQEEEEFKKLQEK